MTIGAWNFEGSVLTNVDSASTPPAEAPITTSCGIGVRPSDIFVLAHLISATRYTHALLWQLSSQTRSGMHARNPLSSALRPVSSIQ